MIVEHETAPVRRAGDPWITWPCGANCVLLCGCAVVAIVRQGGQDAAFASALLLAFAVAVALTPSVAASMFAVHRRRPFAAAAWVALVATLAGVALQPFGPLGPLLDLACAVATTFGTLVSLGVSSIQRGP